MKRRDRSLMAKINGMFAIIIVLACVALSVFSYRLNRQAYLSDLSSQSAVVARTLAQSVEARLMQVEIITAEMACNDDLVRLLREESMAKQILAMVFTVRDEMLDHEAYLATLSADMVALSVNESIPEDYNTLVHESRLDDNAFYRRFRESGARSAWGGPEQPMQDVGASGPVLPYYYTVISGLNRRVGTVRCAVSATRLFAPLLDYEGPGTLTVAREGETLFARGDGGPLRLEAGQWREGSRLYFSAALESLDAQLVLGLDYGAVQMEALRGTAGAVLSILLMGVLLLIVARRVLRAILARLHRLTDAGGAIPEGVYDVKLPEEGPDEVGRLARAFGSLLSRVGAYYDALLQKEKDKRRAQSMALQYQINPHFLFNSLYWLQLRMEEEGVDSGLTESIEQLGRVLHYNLLGVSEALLSEEEQHILAYVSFASAMKGFDIRLTIDMPEALRNVRILRFTLQPLLENAIQHGCAPGQSLSIAIAFSADRAADRFEIAVRNDGKRIPPDKLRALQARLETAARDGIPRADAQSGHGTALCNLARRLALTYEEAARLTVRSDDEETCVTIVLPLSRCLGKEEENHETADRG